MIAVEAVVGQATVVSDMDQPGISKPYFGNQLLEALSLDAARTGFAEIFVDDVDTFMRPTKSDGAIDETILQLRALLMMPHLVNRRLADIDVSELAAMLGRDAFVWAIRRSQHADPPLSARG